MGTITPDENGKAPTKNPIAEQGNQWKPATNKVTKSVANNEEVILSVESDATAEDVSTIEQAEQESELNASEQPDEENEETKDETDDLESTDIPKETADSEQPEEKAQDEDAVAENLMFLPNENDVYAALPSMFGTLARAKAVSKQETEAPSITARYLLLLCDVNVTEKAGAINTASFEAFHAVPTTVAVEGHAERLGTIKMLPGLIKDEITAALLPQRFSVKLTGGINYALMVDWNQEDIGKLNPDEPGTYEIRGTLLVPEDVTLDFETNDVSKEIVRVIVIEEPKQEESQPPVNPDDPNKPPVDPDDPNQPPVDPDDPNKPPVDPDDPNKPPVDPDDPNQPPVDPDDPSKPPVDTDDTESTGNHSRPTRPAASRPQGNSTAGTTTPETPKNETPAGQTPSQTTGTTAQPTEFKDVQRGDWFVDAVEYVSTRGMMNGSGGEFRPNERLTRAMIAQILYNLEGAAGGVPANFPDITADDWCAAAVGWASQSGIMSGYSSGLFGANDSITREQLALTLYRYAQRKGYDLNAAAEFSGFADRAAVSDWALPAMRWAVANGLISGKSDGRLDAHGTATRAEVASILMRFCETFMR